MITKFLFIVLLLSQLILSCKKEFTKEAYSTPSGTKLSAKRGANAQLKIAVVSDIHYMHPC